MTKKALVFIANGTEEIEAVTVIDGLSFSGKRFSLKRLFSCSSSSR
jgi:hypothetical protein